jgi:hypothetical protein
MIPGLEAGDRPLLSHSVSALPRMRDFPPAAAFLHRNRTPDWSLGQSPPVAFELITSGLLPSKGQTGPWITSARSGQPFEEGVRPIARGGCHYPPAPTA